MALFSERKRLKALQLAEASGQSFWTEEIPVEARTKIAYFYDACRELVDSYGFDFQFVVTRHVCIGLGINMRTVDFNALSQMEEAERFLTLVEAIHLTLEGSRQPHLAPQFAEIVNGVFNSYRVAYKLIPEGSQVVELESLELHNSVVDPVIRLLYGQPKLESAQLAYMAALKQISHHDAANAITDAATALQETFKALGVPGKALGDQIKSVRMSGQLPRRDAPMLEALIKALEWVASERNQNGDAHTVTDATLDDAWLIVHIVGALIVRLAGSPRS
ncbi:hypothetical protein NG702_19555 [Pseudarthrobacter sp. MDT3-28]|uniref:hypothetical protein n=1 Tax=Pseudarthrobacter raffinosi TaxID=2953651 RepID=UPI00208E2539|nr:hypothetical protein [Pseudarthrobacter sp. MDT3-28]MCO4239574.1 hypothetical protein [Pseudarthrobacter sp. MDT3-28]